MKEDVPPGTTEAMAADQRADSRFADALVFNQRGDNYTILTVLFALMLVFAAASTPLGRPRAQWILLGLAMTFLIAATVILATFPMDASSEPHPQSEYAFGSDGKPAAEST